MTDQWAGMKGSDTVAEQCGRCGGTGVYSGISRISWENGNGSTTWCFECGGAGTVSILVSSLRARARREEKAAAERAEFAEKAKVARAAWEAAGFDALRVKANGVVVEMRQGDPLREKLAVAAEVLENYFCVEADAEAVRAVLAEIEARAAAAVPVPVGRLVVTGTVRSLKWQESQYGGAWKMLVEGEGWKVWGTCPSALDCERGDVVSFTATVEASDDDPAFGFFKRPTKASVVEKATIDA